MKLIKRGPPFLVMLSLLLSITAQAANYQYFPDVPDDAPYAYEINLLKEAGIFTGDDKGDFLPNKTMTRAEAATLMVKLFVDEDVTKPATGSFTDVPASHWAYAYIETAAKHGLVSGYGNGKFGPNDTLSYEQAVTLLVKAMGYVEEAQAFGGFPDGYIAVGNEVGITEDTVNVEENPVPRNVVAKLIFNAWYGDSSLENDENDDYRDYWDDSWDEDDYYLNP